MVQAKHNCAGDKYVWKCNRTVQNKRSSEAEAKINNVIVVA